jgi:hypothetical protein
MATWPCVHTHFGLSSLAWLDLTAKKCPQEVSSYQPLLSQLLKGLTHKRQLAEVLPSYPIPPGRQGNGAAIGTH